ncbi:MAG: GNAT family N-acetyltransferase [Calothrix sp. MO_167.B42]|nr:GNAT family N-acetyltransferase [Calothrix sp. MO_167.B42]
MNLHPEYHIRRGSTLDKPLLFKFMQLTYGEMFPGQDFAHLQKTVEQYLSPETPLWWADFFGDNAKHKSEPGVVQPSPTPVGCLWAGNAIDQVHGDRHLHIFLLYVAPEHRQQGIATALMKNLESWAKARGDRQIGLQVFQTSTAALNLYQKFGYHTQSLWMVKPLQKETGDS